MSMADIKIPFNNGDNEDTNFQQTSTEINAVESLQPREALITTAVNFLQNDKIRNCPLQQKQKFLRSKGLTTNEIQIACERSGSFSGDLNKTVINIDNNSGSALSSQYVLVQAPSVFGRIKEIINSMTIASGIAYAIYWFYKKYIESFLFGKKKKKTIEESLKDFGQKVESQIRDLNRDVNQLKETVINNNQSDKITREFNIFKHDLDAIKGLLLNRKQFASPMSAVPPSIPAWQLSSQIHVHRETEKSDDAGSGSGSSETEVVTKNSDSSLEI